MLVRIRRATLRALVRHRAAIVRSGNDPRLPSKSPLPELGGISMGICTTWAILTSLQSYWTQVLCSQLDFVEAAVDGSCCFYVRTN